MSNRQERRRRRYSSDGQTTEVTGLGDQILVDGDALAKLFDGPKPPPPGRHQWAMFCVFAVDPLRTNEPSLLDVENLVQVSGPGCYVCEQLYTPEVAARPCPGEPPC